MPNWCMNSLEMEGSEKDIAEFVEKAKKHEVRTNQLDGKEWIYDTALSFDNFIPMPAELKDTRSPYKGTVSESARLRAMYGADNWYDWCVEHWDTKWDVDASYSEAQRLFTFDSAWGPPIKVILAMAKQFPTIKFTLEYEEGGMGFYGTLIVKGDVTIKDEYRNDLKNGTCPQCGEFVSIKTDRECPECGKIIDKFKEEEEDAKNISKPAENPEK